MGSARRSGVADARIPALRRSPAIRQRFGRRVEILVRLTRRSPIVLDTLEA
ncbi:MAG: hypothetical protein R3F05_06025 [Planctomycetota bacterium]